MQAENRLSTIAPIRGMTAVRILVLLLLFFFLLIISAGAGAAVSLVPGISERDAMLTASALQCVVAFCLSAFLAAKFCSDRPFHFLKVDTLALPKAFMGVVIVYILALPAMNQLIAWNASMTFPQWAKGIETTLRNWEDANNAVAMTVLKSSTVWQMLATVGIVGVLTGFSEEVFFRGAMQHIFVDSKISRGVAVWGTAIIFSAIHFQFFGFLPRMLMGAFFGYLIVWTGSLWPSVFAHALNNGMVVVAYYALGDSSSWNIDNLGIAGADEAPWTALASAIATTFFLIRFRHRFFSPNNNT